MEQGFKFYGGKVNPDKKKIWSKDLILQEEKDASDIKFFTPVYEDQINRFMRGRLRVLSKNIYEHIAPQQGAFTHLVNTLVQNGSGVLKNITLYSFTTDKIIFAVQISVPVTNKEWSCAVSKRLTPRSQEQVLVTFYIGLCNEFTALVDKNSDIELAMQVVKHTTAKSLLAEDPLFVPSEVIPTLLKSLRAEQRYCYLPQDGSFNDNPLKNFFYKTPEGFVFCVEIDGYNVLEDFKTI